MSSGAVLAIDQGTSGTTALVWAPDVGTVASATVPVHVDHRDGGTAEVDPQALLASVVEAGRRALGDAAARGVRPAVLGLANQGETVLAWDPGSGEPLTRAVVWHDKRGAEACADLAARGHADRLRHLTGLPLDPYFAAPKMRWIRDHLTRDGVVTTTDAWLVHRLTGAFVTDASTASRTQLLDLDAATWSVEALALFGLGDERLPAVVDGAGPVGTTRLLGPELVLAGLAVDQQAALLAHRCLSAGRAKCTYGTGAFLLAHVGDRALRSSAGLPTSVAWRLGGRAEYCLDGQVYAVGSAVRWLAGIGVLGPGGGGKDLDRVGGTEPDAGGVVLSPAFAGLAAPHWRPDARASMNGLSLATTPGHLVRALLDGVAAQVVDVADAVRHDLGSPVAPLCVDGGLTRSRLLMQAQADLLQAPVEVYPWVEATALGVAALAYLGAGGAADLEAAVPAWTPSAVYEPAIGADEAADRLGRIREVTAGA